MCGITGILNLNHPETIPMEDLKNMTNALWHRGPDEMGIYIDDYAGLGHTRLSIIDLQGGIQPIHNEDKSLWIVYNGEVFNYPELKKKLLKNGHTFYTNTDTEVILHMYEEKGPDCLQELNGQFAIAIWDTKNKSLFLARDRVGIRPLHYAIADNTLVFSSEIKSLFKYRKLIRDLNFESLFQTFTFWAPLPGTTVFKNVYELQPGHYLLISNGTICPVKYWEIPIYHRDEQLDLNADDIADEARELLLDSVKIRLRADVTVGCYLSGGLDSSGVTSMVSNNFNQNVRTFGIGFEQNEFNESDYQRLMVSFLNVNHHEIIATDDDIGSSFPNVVWHCEKPILRTAPVPLYLLSKVVTDQGIKVVLTGEGADEIFGGYNIFREALVRKFWSKQPQSKCRGQLFEKLYPYIFSNPRLAQTLPQFFARGMTDVGDNFYSHMIRWSNTSKIRKYFSEDVLSSSSEEGNYEKLNCELPEHFNRYDVLSRAQYLEIKTFLSNYLLCSQGDRVAMANSLEIRLPFLDYRIIEYMAKIPSHMKIMGLNEKYILKRVFRKMLPPEITNRSKHPYRAPIQKSLFNPNLEYIKDTLSFDNIKSSGIFNPHRFEFLRKRLKADQKISEIEGMALTGVLSTMLIKAKFIDNFSRNTENSSSLSLLIDKRS